jgi:hypothetical protein
VKPEVGGVFFEEKKNIKPLPAPQNPAKPKRAFPPISCAAMPLFVNQLLESDLYSLKKR